MFKDRLYQTESKDAVTGGIKAGVWKQLVQMATGTGKCLAAGTPVLMFDGTIRPVESIRIGEKIMGPNSAPRTVLALGNGIGQMYDVIPNKGGTYRVNDAHILSLKMTGGFKRKSKLNQSILDIEIKDYLASTKTFKHCAKGYRVGISFGSKPVIVDPYFLGLWLGDGNSNSAAITTADVEIETFIQMHAEYLNLKCRKESQGSNNKSRVYHTNTGRRCGRGHHSNTLLNELRSIGVIENKHVPLLYKANNYEVRVQLLSGYLDADGHLTNGGYDFVSVSKTLADDICFVARSLGLACYVKQCQKACQTGSIGIYYRGSISGDISILKCKLERKQGATRKQKKDHLVTGIKVVPVGIEKYYGFQIDGDGRFVLGDFTVTHNTIVFAKLYEHLKPQLPGKMLVLAHREELIDQNIDKLRRVNPSLRVDKEMADHHADPANADIVVASVATLGRKGTKRLEEYDWSQFDKIVVDEAHHSVAQSYMNILEVSGALKEGSNKLLLGVTATPQRGDGQALAKIYQKVVYSYPLRKAIEDGWLVEIRGYKVSTSTSLDGVKTVAGEYEQGQLADTVNTPERNQLIVKAWLERGENRQTVVFGVDVRHAKDMAEMFQKNGIKAEAIWGDDPDRGWKLARHKGIDAILEYCVKNNVPIPSPNEMQELLFPVIVNCGILIEGYDDWCIGCVIPAAPTKSPTKFAQIIGRLTRLQDGIGNLIIAKHEHRNDSKFNFKTDGIVIDPVDNSSRNTLVTLPTLMGMSSVLDLHGKGLVESVHELEAAQQQYPYIDFTKLKDITELQTHISSIDLFEFHFPPVVDENSELSWFLSPTGSYILMLPNKEHLEIEQNLVDKWEIHGVIRGKKYRGERDTIEAAFMAADDTIFKVCPEALKILRKKDVWHDDPATPDQLKCIRKFYKKELAAGTMVIPPTLTKGQASRRITQKLAGKRKLRP